MRIDANDGREVADSVIGGICLRCQTGGGNRIFSVVIEADFADIHTHERGQELLAKSRGESGCNRNRALRDGFGLPENHIILRVVLANCARIGDCFAVEFGGIDLTVANGFESGGMRAGITNGKVMVRVQPRVAQAAAGSRWPEVEAGSE